MDTEQSKKALEKVAMQEGVSIEEVRREIELAIRAARANPDTEVQAFWNSLPQKGNEFTPEDLIAYIAGIIEENDKIENAD